MWSSFWITLLMSRTLIMSDCAWEAGFEYGIVIVPITFTMNEWENSPERYSLLAKAVEADGVLL
jgi:hypothetical protein